MSARKSKKKGNVPPDTIAAIVPTINCIFYDWVVYANSDKKEAGGIGFSSTGGVVPFSSADIKG